MSAMVKPEPLAPSTPERKERPPKRTLEKGWLSSLMPGKHLDTPAKRLRLETRNGVRFWMGRPVSESDDEQLAWISP